MRPHVLTVEAMGPFAGLVTVDFDDLAQGGLFLIHGRTGSGKTSLLDALCFALYGEVPGARGDRGLRSDHAAPDATPRATLEFSAHGGRYRVAREPYHEAPKRRGGGVTVRNPTATLVRLDAGHEATVATKPVEVKAEVLRLVGLDARQFQQVILLPQGQFEAVLRGKAETREGLLKTLFHTVGFEQLAEWLADQARQQRTAVRELQRELAILANEAGRRGAELARPAPSATGAPTDADEPLFTPTEHGRPDQAGLDRLATRAEEALTEAEARLARTEAALVAHHSTVEHVAQAAERWDRYRDATATHVRLQAATPTIDAARVALARAAQAEPIGPSLAQVAQRVADVERAEAAAQRELTAADRARRRLVRTLGPVDALDLRVGVPAVAELAEARQALTAERATLDALQATVQQASTARSTAEQRRAAEARAVTLVAEAGRVRQDLTVEIVASAERVAEATSARHRLPGLTEAARTAEERAEAATRVADVGRRLATATTLLGHHEASAQQAQVRHLQLRVAYLEGIAAVLAGDLANGSPCGVCGSEDHPRPAAASPGAATAEQVDAAEVEHQTAHGRVLAQRQVVADLASADAAARAVAGEHADDQAAAEATAADARRAHRVADIAAATLAGLERDAEDRRSTLTALEERATSLAAEVEGLRAAAVHAEQDAADADERLATALGTDVDLGRALTAVDAADAALATLATLAGTTEAARAALDQARERLAADLAASPFAAEDEARAAQLGARERDRSSAEVEQHQLRFARVLDVLGDPLLADLPADRPDVATARRAADAAEAAKVAAVAHRTRIHGAHERIDQLAAEHGEILARLLPLEEQADRSEAVANRCAGKVAPKVSLQRWVLATYLEGICEHANRRLATMTAGRYQLRVERDAVHAAAKAGLDLWVLDAHTGTERPVSTLSGGETFQASLALALGVADSVEARTGGVRLEALFVDEGFGTLDPESLQLAMDELDGLREGGRMVGLISHVGALRERIRVGIEVTPSDLGSTVRVGQIDAA